MTFPCFMASPSGRGLRILLGFALIIAGFVMQTTPGWILAAVGLVPIAAGVFDWCPFSPLFGASFFGNDVRKNCP